MSELREFIKIRGARLHNLQSVNADIPTHAITAVCGPSGSGKTSLALGTLHSESQRRYLETLNPYIAQLAGAGAPIPVDSIEGLGPSIAFKSGAYGVHTRASVGSITECDTLLRQIWVSQAQLTCPHCHTPLCTLTAQQMLLRILQYPERARLHILAPIPGKGRTLQEIAADLLSQGFMRLLLKEDAELKEAEQEFLAAELSFEQQKLVPAQVFAVVDRVIIKENMRSRLADSIETALRIGGGALWIKHEAAMAYMSLSPQCPTHGLLLSNYNANLYSPHSLAGRCATCAGLGYAETTPETPCPDCAGIRLQPLLRHSRWEAWSWEQLQNLPGAELLPLLGQICTDLPPVLHISLQQLQDRLGAMNTLGLGHLALQRGARTLSDGEMLRLRLVPLAGGHLANLLFVLDEPGSGLHPHDCEGLWQLLLQIQRRHNTLVLIEHHPQLVSRADWIIEMGPGAGEAGGAVLAQGPRAQVLDDPHSPTGQWLRDPQSIAPLIPYATPAPAVEFTTSFRHLKNLRVAIPTGAMTLIAGVSGAGKSTLAFTVLAQLIAAPPSASASSATSSADRTDPANSATSVNPIVSPSCENSADFNKNLEATPSAYGVLHERANIFEVITVDSSYLRGNKRSLVATVTDLLTPLRQLFASTTAAKAKGYKATRFSPNNAGGRCEACVGMGYLADPTQFGTTPCHICQGRRFRDEILEIRFKTLNFAEVLDLSIDQAAQLFKDFPPLQKKLQPLREVGLGYLRLGHPTTHCSAGEMQRLKLAAELQRIPERPCLYLFDEPARGLHQSDTLHLLQLMQRLLSQGHTIVVVEHQAAFRAAAHQIIEMGPSAGAQGGEIISIINRLNPQPRP